MFCPHSVHTVKRLVQFLLYNLLHQDQITHIFCLQLLKSSAAISFFFHMHVRLEHFRHLKFQARKMKWVKLSCPMCSGRIVCYLYALSGLWSEDILKLCIQVLGSVRESRKATI